MSVLSGTSVAEKKKNVHGGQNEGRDLSLCVGCERKIYHSQKRTAQKIPHRKRWQSKTAS